MKICTTKAGKVIEMKKESLIHYSFRIEGKFIGWATRKTTFKTGPYYGVTLIGFEGEHIYKLLKDVKDYVINCNSIGLFD